VEIRKATGANSDASNSESRECGVESTWHKYPIELRKRVADGKHGFEPRRASPERQAVTSNLNSSDLFADR